MACLGNATMISKTVESKGEEMKRQSGATMVEYLLMVTFIAIALIAVIILFQGSLSDNVGESANCLQSINTSGASDCPGVAQD